MKVPSKTKKSEIIDILSKAVVRSSDMGNPRALGEESGSSQSAPVLPMSTDTAAVDTDPVIPVSTDTAAVNTVPGIAHVH